MKARIIIYQLLILGLILFCSAFGYAQPISSSDLINNAKLYDGKSVVYEGEVIGDIMVRGDYAWINVNDGNSAIGIWINASLLTDISYTGSYKSRGDTVEITGTFHRACSQHGGDLDIHGQALRKISSGQFRVEPYNAGKRNLILALVGVLCLILTLRQLIKT